MPKKRLRLRARSSKKKRPLEGIQLPTTINDVSLDIVGRRIHLTNLKKLFWPELGITKGDLLQYYTDVSPFLLPHLRNRAMVLKRYPEGAMGEFFCMKSAPEPRPDWIKVCSIQHHAGMVDFVMIQDLASLLWVINLGCIDLNQWDAHSDNVDRPDYLHFDLDPVEGANFNHVLEASILVHRSLDRLSIPNYAKTTGSRGIHIYVPIHRGPTQKEVWVFAKRLAHDLAQLHPSLFTAEYRIAKRPHGRVLLDYNQNAWGRTLTSAYSVLPTPQATVSTPVTWKEVEAGLRIQDFRITNVPERVRRLGDLWEPLLSAKGRFHLKDLL